VKIALFGASSATGKLLIEDALARGDEIVAFVRQPASLSLIHDHLRIVQGELSNQEALEKAVEGVDAVISVLGPRGKTEDRPLTQGMKNLLRAMTKQNVHRLVALSTLSAPDSQDRFDLRAAFMVTMIKLTVRSAYEEFVNMATLVRASDRDWTLVRVSLLNNHAPTGKIRAGYPGKKEVGVFVSRGDLAQFLLQQARETTYLRQAPALSN
jgi:hypothetical protein